MRLLLRSPRPTLVHFLGVLAVTATIAGCTSDSPSDGDDDGTDDGPGEPQACAEPGSPLLEGAKPAPPPGESSPPFSCGSGWATDVPQLEATWTIALPVVTSEYGFIAATMVAHPDGGAVVAGSGLFARYDEDGEAMWTVDGAVPSQAQIVLAVDDSGTTVLSYYDWSNETGGVNRFAADGSAIGPVAIPWNSPDYTQVWGLVPYADELVVGGVDVDAGGSWETTLKRLDAADSLLLRKSTNTTNGGQLAVNDGTTIAFGSFPTFLLAYDNGAVRGTLAPSQGGLTDVEGLGDGFVIAGTASGDFTVGRYSEFGVEQWLQTYDRAALGDNGRAIAAGPNDTMVAVGSTSLLDFTGIYWFGTQPWIVGVDGDGNATWADRIDAVGEASAVAFGSGGEVYVLGVAEGVDEIGTGEPEQIAWLRRYDPPA